MGKALVGGRSDLHSVRLLEEIRSLRARVAELEAALERAEEALATGRVDPGRGDPGRGDPESVDAGPEDPGPRAAVAAGESTAS